MNNLKLVVMVFIAGFTIFFNIERLDFDQENLIDISSFIYILGVIAIISTLVVPVLERASLPKLIAFWTLMYLLGKIIVLMFSRRPLFGGIYTYLSITELTLFLILISLTHWLILAMNRFETSIENLAFTNLSNRVRQMNEAAEDIQVEMFRSRHNHHPLSVVIVEPNPLSVQEVLSASLKEVRQVILNSYVVNRMSSTLSKYLRRSDMILAQPEQSRFIILCPDTGAQELKLLVEYIQIVAQEQLGTAVVCGMATFPGDAVTFEELIHKAETRLQKLNGHEKEHGGAELIVAPE